MAVMSSYCHSGMCVGRLARKWMRDLMRSATGNSAGLGAGAGAGAAAGAGSVTITGRDGY